MGHASISTFLKHYLSRRITVDTQAVVRALASKISQERQRRRHALLKEIKERWEFEQPVRDVEQQLAGLETKDNLELVHEVMLPAQGDLVDSVLSTPGTTIEEEMDRRNRAIRAVTLYCGVEEGGMNPIRRGGRSRNATPPAKSQLEYEEEALEAAKVSVYKEKRPKL
ncbi:repeatdomain containing protein [Pyrenophora tritici-repentis]|nr:repeatdomain containing protein [Pyrenophora tritici-repentis]KAI1531739.1 repeatdomain containing protein [Pyrenophora tritici-repentis]